MLINGVVLIISGLIAVPTAFLPAKWINKILPYKPYVGVICLIIGVWELISSFQHLLAGGNLFIPIIGLIFSMAKINMGIILGYKLIEKQILEWKNKKTVDGLHKRSIDFILFKTAMSFIAIGLGFCQVVISFFVN